MSRIDYRYILEGKGRLRKIIINKLEKNHLSRRIGIEFYIPTKE